MPETIIRRNDFYNIRAGRGTGIGVQGGTGEGRNGFGNRVYHNNIYRNGVGAVNSGPPQSSNRYDNLYVNNIMLGNFYTPYRSGTWHQELAGKPVQIKLAESNLDNPAQKFISNNIIGFNSDGQPEPNLDYVISNGFDSALGPGHLRLQEWIQRFPNLVSADNV